MNSYTEIHNWSRYRDSQLFKIHNWSRFTTGQGTENKRHQNTQTWVGHVHQTHPLLSKLKHHFGRFRDGGSQWNHIFWTREGSSVYEVMVVMAPWIGPMQVKATQHPSIDWRGCSEVLPLVKELLVTESCWKKATFVLTVWLLLGWPSPSGWRHTKSL